MELISKLMQLFLLIICSPLFLTYLTLCFTIPLIKFGPIKKGKERKIYISKDMIHSDFIFHSEDIKDLFNSKCKYIKVGWGDRKIFLETQSWNKLKISDFFKAFFGLNKTVLRVEFINELEYYKIIEVDNDQIYIIKNYIKDSFDFDKKIIKKECEYQYGDYYESNLKYNCINTCNNWVNSGLKLAKLSNRIWCPISFWI